MITLETKLSVIEGIGVRFLGRLKKLGIETVKDLLWHFPTRYEDYSQIYKIADLMPHQEVTIRGFVQEIIGRRTWRRHLYLVEALISDDSGSIRAVWFNQPYVKNILRPGRVANFAGKVIVSEGGEIYLSNPTYELIPQAQTYADYPQTNTDEFSHGAASISTPVRDWKHTGRIVPVYPETKGLTSKGLRYLIKPILNNLEEIVEIFPEEILEKRKLPDINTAIQKIHFPNILDEALQAKKRFSFEDLFLLQLCNLSEKIKLSKEKSKVIKIDIGSVKKLIGELPFELTFSQKKSLWEILKDLSQPHPMNRLLQGDVGSGKTIIAAIAAIVTAKNNYQTAFMAPTEILARQHYQTFIKFFPKFNQGIVLLTGSEAKISYSRGLETDINKGRLQKEIAEGRAKIIIGTHALLQEKVKFASLAFIIIDEQHRFGVRQRAALLKNYEASTSNQREYANNKKSAIHISSFTTPHLLSMSATPIPRTLSLTLFGDLDLSLITELPKNRKTIITKVVDPANRNKAYQFIREQIKKGRQAFVICPRIEPTVDNQQLTTNKWQQLEIKSVKEEFNKLSN